MTETTTKENSEPTAAPAETESAPVAAAPEGNSPSTAKIPRSCEQCARWKEVKRQMGIARILENAVANFQTKLGDPKFTPTVAEYLKLVQMEQEYEKELNPPEEIRVTWVEPTTES